MANRRVVIRGKSVCRITRAVGRQQHLDAQATIDTAYLYPPPANGTLEDIRAYIAATEPYSSSSRMGKTRQIRAIKP